MVYSRHVPTRATPSTVRFRARAVPMTFAELGVAPVLDAALAKQGITEPTPIQAAAIPVLSGGGDAYLLAETGTGKTLAYLLPLLAQVELDPPATQVVILAPTHELAIQIQRVCTDLAQHAGVPLRVLLLIGGTSLERQIEKLKKKPHVVVGSPGRIRDLLKMGKLKSAAVRHLVVDEADRLLAGDGLPDVRAVLRALPAARQVVFASATEPPECAAAIEALVPGTARLEAGTAPVNANIEHLYLVCEARDKPDVLRRLLHALRPERAMVFVHRAETAEDVAAKLAHHGIPAADLHGARDKRDRKRAMDDFRSGAVPVLIASDVGARGLDIAGITHVVNLDAPSESRAYLHRVGRTARAGAAGQAVTLLTEPETRLVARYEGELGIAMQPVRLREGRLVAVGAPAGPGRTGA